MAEKMSWLQLKYYQYELNTGIYMLEPWEKKLFNFILLGFILMGFVTTVLFLPASIERGKELFGFA